MEIFSQVRSRSRNVRWGIVVFVLALLVHVVATNALFFVWLGDEQFASDKNLERLLWAGGLVGAACLIQFLLICRSGEHIARVFGAVRLDEAVASDPSLAAKAAHLHNIVDELCIAAACRKPAIFLLEKERGINAFAAGFTRSGWCIAITRGVLEDLPRDELQALLAHELAHLVLRDTRNVVFLAATIAGLGLILMAGLSFAALTARAREGAVVALLGLALAFFGLVGALIACALEAIVSRQQEFRADAEGVRLCRDSRGMVALLERLATNARSAAGDRYDIEHCGVTGRLLRSMNFDYATRKGLFESHPPLVARIRVFDPVAAERVAKFLSKQP
jgi:Zn-dependent protease with chaperone function